MTPIELCIDGVDASLLAVDGERVEIACPRAYAPGTPLHATLEGGELHLKVIRSRRHEDQGFRVQARLFNLTRAMRDRLRCETTAHEVGGVGVSTKPGSSGRA